MAQVWLLETGQHFEGGFVVGVYASKADAKQPFIEAATGIPFSIDTAWQDEDGAVNVTGGCDWVSLTPYEVTGRLQIAA